MAIWTIGNLLPIGKQLGFRVNLDLIHLSCIQIPNSPLHDLLRNDLRWSLQKAAQWPFGQGQGGLTSHLQWRWWLIGGGWSWSEDIQRSRLGGFQLKLLEERRSGCWSPEEVHSSKDRGEAASIEGSILNCHNSSRSDYFHFLHRSQYTTSSE